MRTFWTAVSNVKGGSGGRDMGNPLTLTLSPSGPGERKSVLELQLHQRERIGLRLGGVGEELAEARHHHVELSADAGNHRGRKILAGRYDLLDLGGLEAVGALQPHDAVD